MLRGPVPAGAIDARRADVALADLAALPLQRAPHRPLLSRCWQLRDNLTIYDAAYVALAEALQADLFIAGCRLPKPPDPAATSNFTRHSDGVAVGWFESRRVPPGST